MQLAGKTALLTGATGGLGRAIALVLAARGATLVLSSRRGAELSELARSLPGEGHRSVVSDLAEEGAAERLGAEVGPIDVLVANAGLPASGQLDEFSQDEIGRALRVNLESPVRMAREVLPAMRERGGGHVVFVASVAGKVASPRTSLYSATKFGLRGFALGLREDLWRTGVGVSLVLPGFIRDAGLLADAGAPAPMGLGTAAPSEVGEAVAVAIERDRAEVEVAPLRQRVVINLGHWFPRLASRFQRAGGAAKIADRIASGQTEKR